MSIAVDGDDLIERFDVQLVGRLASDETGVQLHPSAVAAHANVTTAIQDALGRFEAAVQSGGRYTVAELDTLTTTSLAYAKRLICNLAMMALMLRRPGTHTMEREHMMKETEGALNALAAGKDVFTLEPQLESGLLDMHQTTESVRVMRSLIADRLRGHLTTFGEDPPA